MLRRARAPGNRSWPGWAPSPAIPAVHQYSAWWEVIPATDTVATPGDRDVAVTHELIVGPVPVATMVFRAALPATAQSVPGSTQATTQVTTQVVAVLGHAGGNAPSEVLFSAAPVP